MKALLIAMTCTLAACCPLSEGDRVKHVITGKTGTVISLEGYGVDDCTCLVLFDDKTYSQHAAPHSWRIDNRYADNFDFLKLE